MTAEAKNTLLPDDELSRSVFIEFIDESLDALDGLDTQLIEFESNSSDLTAINAIFRPIHSVKGNSAFFGMMKTKKLAHVLEDLLDLLRKEKRHITPELMHVLLKGFDALRNIFNRVREGGLELDDSDAFDALVAEVEQTVNEPQVEGTVWPQLIDKLDRMFILLRKQDQKLVEEVETLLSSLRSQIPEFAAAETPAPEDKSQPTAKTPLDLLANATREPLETDKKALKERANMANEALAIMAKHCPPETEAAQKVSKAQSTLQTFLNTVGFDAMIAKHLREEIEVLAALPELKVLTLPASTTQGIKTPETGKDHVQPKTRNADVGAPVQETTQHTSAKTLRISEEQLDVFLSYVGELVVVGKMFDHLNTQAESGNMNQYAFSSHFRHVNETFEVLSQNLQQSIMNLRRMPIKNAFSKIPRLVHDVAIQKNKDIQVLVEDNNVFVDKSLIDMLDAPLTHMVRNAADHGIESKEKRTAAGKRAQGQVRVSAHDETDTVRIEISDDGDGLNMDALQRKGVEMGILAKDSKPSMEKVKQIIFAPGMSTSSEITDISGRGVGMDVVKRAIESAGGNIDIASTPGKGTTFTITLHKTISTQILSGFLIRVESNILVLPMERVLETAQIARKNVTSVKGRSECIQRHGQIVPLVSLAQILQIDSHADREQQTVVVVNVQGQSKALIVDELVGVQQVVVKPIEGMEGLLKGVSGGALMGDGSVGLVLDLETLSL